jgi:hypothetical protein
LQVTEIEFIQYSEFHNCFGAVCNGLQWFGLTYLEIVLSILNFGSCWIYPECTESIFMVFKWQKLNSSSIWSFITVLVLSAMVRTDIFGNCGYTHLSGPLQYPIQFTNIVPKYKSWHPRQIFIHLLPMMQTCTSNTHDQHIIISYNSPVSGHIISCSVIFPILDVFLEITNTTIFYNGQNSWWLFIILSPMAQTCTFDTGDHHTISWCIFVCTLAYHDISIILGGNHKHYHPLSTVAKPYIRIGLIIFDKYILYPYKAISESHWKPD